MNLKEHYENLGNVIPGACTLGIARDSMSGTTSLWCSQTPRSQCQVWPFGDLTVSVAFLFALPGGLKLGMEGTRSNTKGHVGTCSRK